MARIGWTSDCSFVVVTEEPWQLRAAAPIFLPPFAMRANAAIFEPLFAMRADAPIFVPIGLPSSDAEVQKDVVGPGAMDTRLALVKLGWNFGTKMTPRNCRAVSQKSADPLSFTYESPEKASCPRCLTELRDSTEAIGRESSCDVSTLADCGLPPCPVNWKRVCLGPSAWQALNQH